MTRVINHVSGTFATLRAAFHAAAAVNAGRRPNASTLRTLGISEEAFDNINFSR